MNRIKSLDGLRAISIIMVLLGHLRETMPHYLTDNRLFWAISNSTLGVNVFFVISGYLITKLLVAEKVKTGDVSLKQFYIRRAFRIFPVFYLYIIVLILLKIFFIPDIVGSNKSFVFAGLYLWSYMQFFHFWPGVMGGWFLGHFWSLAMEEQFYLLWPVTFLLVASRKRLKNIVLIVILLMPVLRVAVYFLLPMTRTQIGIMLPTAGDGILLGCLGALFENDADFKQRFSKYFENKYLVAFAFIFLFIIGHLLSNRFKGGYDLPIGTSLNNICILLILFWSVYVPSFFQKILNNKILIQIGLLSYSLYIWQQLFLTNLIDSWLNKFPQNIFVVFAVGFFSYYLIEKPILKLKNRFTKVAPIK